ncbi:MAG: hypothetical protein WBG71_06825 [Leeuwenhoekiella sp.]
MQFLGKAVNAGLILKRTLLLFLLTAVVISCSRKRNNFVSRSFHAVTAEYNTLYNGDLALTEGQRGLEDSYLDNYWEILPVERLEQQDFMNLPGEDENPNFDRAEEKAIKAIQKHSMIIDGKERNPQIDEAYMLLGKSRYYSSRFLRAIEAFNFILATYPASNNIAQAKIWKAKTNIRLSNEQVAIRRLKNLVKYETQLSDQDYADASAMLAQGYINLEELDSAAVYLQKAVTLTRKNEERGRYYFILGQISDRLDQTYIANAYYDSVINLNRRIPRRYMINAYMAKARNFDNENGDDDLFQFEQLTDLAENRENRPFLDMIYNQFAEYYLQQGIEDSAINYYNYSLRQGSRDEYLVSRNYLNLAEIAFENTEYALAAAYYDSTLTTSNEKTREYRRITKKRDNLDDVIMYEEIASTNDSILRLVNFTEEERESYFQKYIDSLVARDEAIRKEQKKNNVKNNEFFTENPINQNSSGEFYFYNSTAVAQGKLAFESRWGDRDLTDNWRVSSVASGGDGALDDDLDLLLDEGDGGIVYRIEDYLEQIPSDPGVIDTLNLERNDAYFQLGVIYKEKFREYELAASKLEGLLNNDPNERLILPANYNLYQIYNALNDATAETYKNTILQAYSDSRYAELLRNPGVKVEALAGSPEVLFDSLTNALRRQEFERVIAGTNTFIAKNTGEKLMPKFELLRAAALGRFYGFEAYKQSLNEIALTYPNTDEGKEAQRLIDETLPQMEDAAFKPTDVKDNWKLLYVFPAPAEDFDVAKEILDLGLEEYGYSGYNGSQDVYGPDLNLLVVHGFRSEGEALAFAKKLSTDKEFDWEYEANTITSANYRIVQLHKNLQLYLENKSN